MVFINFTTLALQRVYKGSKWSTAQVIMVVAIVSIIQYCFHVVYLHSESTDSESNINSRALLGVNDYDEIEIEEYSRYKFGHQAKKHFVLDPFYTEFQFGSYGNAPKEVLKAQQQTKQKIEACPSCFMVYDRDTELIALIKDLAKYLNIENYEDLVFISNASNGLNAVIKSIARIIYNNPKCGASQDEHCKILLFNTAFASLYKTVQFVNNDPSSPSNQVIEFNLTREMLSDTDLLINNLDEFLKQYADDIYIAMFSQVTAYPNTVLDAKRLVQLFRDYDIMTFIDDAHAFGQIKLDISDINPDIWLSNGHKWFYSIRGASVMYIKREVQDDIYPPVVTNRYKTKQELAEFSNATHMQFHWQGTMDDSIWLSVRDGLAFRNKFGDDAIIEYLHDLAITGGEAIVSIWNTSMLITDEAHIGAIINPILPSVFGVTWTESVAKDVERLLYSEFNTIVYIKQFDGYWYMRLMAAIHLEVSDFEWLADSTLTVLYRLRIGDYDLDKVAQDKTLLSLISINATAQQQQL